MERISFLIFAFMFAASSAAQIWQSFIVFGVGIVVGIACILAADRHVRRRGRRS